MRLNELRCLLLQVRNPDDPMRVHEVECFARTLGIHPEQIRVFDLLSGEPGPADYATADLFLLGGSGHYSAAGSGPWLDRALHTLRRVYDLRQPTFASCWGFQAMARAMGGRVEKVPEQAEVGTHTVFLTEAGHADPVFGLLGDSFPAQMGHEDCVVELPPGATLLASSQRCRHQAFRFHDRPIYCTQFHPELSRDDLLQRVNTYPEYVERLAEVPFEEFCRLALDTPDAAMLLRRFVCTVFGNEGSA